jgi:hypothetical protein
VAPGPDGKTPKLATLRQYLLAGQYQNAWTFASQQGLMLFLEQSNGLALLQIPKFTQAQMSQYYEVATQGFWNINVLGNNPYPNTLWGDPGNWAGDAVTNFTATDDNSWPDVARFAGKRPSESFFQKWGIPIIGVIASIVTWGAASGAIGAIDGAIDATADATVDAGVTAAGATTITSTTLTTVTTTTISAAGAVATTATPTLLGAAVNVATSAVIGTAVNGVTDAITGQKFDLGSSLLSGLEGGALGTALAPVSNSIGSDLSGEIGKTAGNFVGNLATGTIANDVLNGGNLSGAFENSFVSAGLSAYKSVTSTPSSSSGMDVSAPTQAVATTDDGPGLTAPIDTTLPASISSGSLFDPSTVTPVAMNVDPFATTGSDTSPSGTSTIESSPTAIGAGDATTPYAFSNTISKDLEPFLADSHPLIATQNGTYTPDPEPDPVALNKPVYPDQGALIQGGEIVPYVQPDAESSIPFNPNPQDPNATIVRLGVLENTYGQLPTVTYDMNDDTIIRSPETGINWFANATPEQLANLDAVYATPQYGYVMGEQMCGTIACAVDDYLKGGSSTLVPREGGFGTGNYQEAILQGAGAPVGYSSANAALGAMKAAPDGSTFLVTILPNDGSAGHIINGYTFQTNGQGVTYLIDGQSGPNLATTSFENLYSGTPYANTANYTYYVTNTTNATAYNATAASSPFNPENQFTVDIGNVGNLGPAANDAQFGASLAASRISSGLISAAGDAANVGSVLLTGATLLDAFGGSQTAQNMLTLSNGQINNLISNPNGMGGTLDLSQSQQLESAGIVSGTTQLAIDLHNWNQASGDPIGTANQTVLAVTTAGASLLPDNCSEGTCYDAYGNEIDPPMSLSSVGSTLSNLWSSIKSGASSLLSSSSSSTVSTGSGNVPVYSGGGGMRGGGGR